MYEVLVNFIGTPPDGCESFLYISCIPFTLYLVFEFYTFLRILVMRVVSKYGRS